MIPGSARKWIAVNAVESKRKSHEKNLSSKSAFFTPRTLLTLLLCGAACSIVTGTLLGFFHPEASTKVSQRTLTFPERVAYQRAIEDVYWRHRIWPKERPDSKAATSFGDSV